MKKICTVAAIVALTAVAGCSDEVGFITNQTYSAGKYTPGKSYDRTNNASSSNRANNASSSNRANNASSSNRANNASSNNRTNLVGKNGCVFSGGGRLDNRCHFDYSGRFSY